MIHTWLKAATAVAAAGAIAFAIAPAEAKSKQRRATNPLDAHAQQYPNWERVTSAPRGSRCNGPCGRYNLPPGGGINYLDGGNGAGYYGGG